MSDLAAFAPLPEPFDPDSREASAATWRTDGEQGGFEHLQEEPAEEWRISHGLGRRFPQVRVFDTSSGNRVIPAIEYTSVNALKVKFRTPRAGVAYVSP